MNNNLPASRKEALQTGYKWYFTGKFCVNGHIDKRLSSNGVCWECSRERTEKWREENKDKRRDYFRNWRRENLEWRNEYHSRWCKENSEKCREYTRRRDYLKTSLLPKWADQELIDLIYEECPEGCEVDHYYPLVSKKVCGLHVENNLRYLPISLNRSKGNKMPESFPCRRY